MELHSAVLFETNEEMYARVYREMRPRAGMPDFAIEFCKFANANSFIKMEGGRIAVRICDVLEGAPAPVREALAFILLAKLFRKPVAAKYNDRYRRFLNRQDMRRNLHLIRQIRGRKIFDPPKGRFYDLEAMFEELNLRFFHGLMARPELGWTKRPSRTILGHYDPSHNAIVINRIMDREDVPRLAVEYVLYHEMLHLRHPAEHNGTKRRVHTKAFREAEKAFPDLEKAIDLLTKL